MQTTYKRKKNFILDWTPMGGVVTFPQNSQISTKRSRRGRWVGDGGALKGAIMASRVALATLTTFDTICPGCRYFQAGRFLEG